MSKWVLAISVVALLCCPAMGEKTKSFCEYGKGIAVDLGAAGGTWVQTWNEKPCDWYECEASPNVGILGGNVVGRLSTYAVGLPEIDEENQIARIPLKGQLTLTAMGKKGSNDGAGQIKGKFEGTFVVDGLADHAIVKDGVVTIRFGSSVEEGPDGLIEVTETTGKFKNIVALGPWEWHVDGTIRLLHIPENPQVPGWNLQMNILAALQDPALILGAEEEIVLAGSYTRVSSFCEYGFAESVELGAGQGLWDQYWGFEPWDWYDCGDSPNVSFLKGNVKGVFETVKAGTAAVSPDLVLSLPFGGFLDVIAYDRRNPNKVVGRINGDIDYDSGEDEYDGVLAVDINPTRAVVDPVAGTIEIKLGAAIETDAEFPPSLVTVVETTGTFKGIEAAGKWEFHVAGTLLIEYDPVTYPVLFDNIFAGLGNPGLLRGATEEIVLAGSYYRSKPK